MGSPLLAVAGSAVHVLVRAIATDDGIQLLSAITALVALAMPFTALGQDLLCSIHHATTTWATLSRLRLDNSGVDDRNEWSTTSAEEDKGY